MCLYKKSRLPRIALRDIVVYKRLKVKNNRLFTPIVGTEVTIGKVYKGIFDTLDCHYILAASPNFIRSLISKYIDTGYIHSYIDKSYIAKSFNTVIAQCIIPKGTLYFIGDVEDIASRKIKYIKICE